MGRRYMPEEKQAALDTLVEYSCDVARTSYDTGIPERTLREWKRELVQEYRDTAAIAADPLPPAAAETAEETEEAYDSEESDQRGERIYKVHEKILSDIEELSGQLALDLKLASPYQRMQAISMLIDRLDKLDKLIPKNMREYVIKAQYVDEDGSVHKEPYWDRMGAWKRVTGYTDEMLMEEDRRMREEEASPMREGRTSDEME